MSAHDRFTPGTREDDRAHTSAFPTSRFLPPALPDVPSLQAADVTSLEREAVNKLRTSRGFYNGDATALRVLRDFAAKLINSELSK